MASGQQSPVLVQHSSPAHSLTPEVTVIPVSPSIDHSSTYNPVSPPHSGLRSAPTNGENQPLADPTETQPWSDAEMADAQAEPDNVVDIPETFTNSTQDDQEGNQSGTTVEEAMDLQSALGGQVHLQDSAAMSNHEIQERSEDEVMGDGEVQNAGTATNEVDDVQREQSSDAATESSPQRSSTEDLKPVVPDWVTWEDDSSTPDEQELKEIESEPEVSAMDVPKLEECIYHELDDTELRPFKKLRLSWVIKGIRGTRERPNMAKTMNSPSAFVDGNYWQISLYPRGNKSSSLSAYIRCSRRPPTPDKEVPESHFSYFEGPPEANLGEGAQPKHSLDISATPIEYETKTISKQTDSVGKSKIQVDDDCDTSDSDSEASSDGDVPMTDADRKDVPTKEEIEDYRVSAQLGMVIYNPAEPRVNTYMSSEHQFNRFNDDWGWTSFVGPWTELHLRKRGQRQALLRNDTIAIDAYIRIFDDPTQALWWHSAPDHENQWPSKELAGYFPMGTPPLYHSPAVAGITAWLLLKPFREILQKVDTLKWRQNPQVKPQPIIAHLQMILYLMRTMRKEDYVNVYPVIEAMTDLGEPYSDVISFWEAFRRSIELELDQDETSMKQIADIFNSPGRPIPALPVQDVTDIQGALQKVLGAEEGHISLPNFLPLTLERHIFHEKSREWRLLHNRVKLNDEIDLSAWSPLGSPQKYTLYGFMVHVGERNSGRFYTVLRPNGPGSKWLAFEDGDGNKVFSYTKARIQEFEGLEGEELKNFKSVRQTAYMAMYIKNECFQDYLPGKLEHYKLPKWLVSQLEVRHHDEYPREEQEEAVEKSDTIDIEVFSDEDMFGREGLLDMFNIKKRTRPEQVVRFSMPLEASFADLRHKLASELDIENVKRIRLFAMSYAGVGHYMSAQMEPLDMDLHHTLSSHGTSSKVLCLWMSLLVTDDDIQSFGYPDPISPPETISKEGEGDVGADEGRDVDQSDTNAAGGSTLGHDEQSSTPDDIVAAPDATEDSVRQAVAADVGLIEYSEPQIVSSGQNRPQPTSQTSDDLQTVEHGHLFDAIMSEAVAPEHAQPNTLLDLAEAIIGSAQEVMEATHEDGANDAIIGTVNEEMRLIPPHARESEENRVVTAEQHGQPIPHLNVYGFIQLFDIEKQNFVVHSTFFAHYNDDVRETLRKKLSYDSAKEFIVWHRETPLDGSRVVPKATFDQINFTNGVDIIVGDKLSDDQVQELETVGKFANPFQLSRFLRMSARRHPILGQVHAEEVETCGFGEDYYRGPLVNGRSHGNLCVRVSSAGHRYEGPLVCDKKTGKNGKMIYQNGDVYEGGWLNDEKHGYGSFSEKRTGNRYEGGFENGKRWGKGVTYWEVADEEAAMCQICYCEDIDALFYDCGHVCACVECARQCDVCPICRRSVRQVVKMYRA